MNVNFKSQNSENRGGFIAKAGYDLIPGAVFVAQQQVPAHFGQPFREEEWLIEGKAFADLSFLEVLSVAGEDRRKWLHSLTTCDFSNLSVGESSEMLVLSPNGQIEHAAAVMDDGKRVWMILDSQKADALADFLTQMKFMMRVEIERHDFAVIGFSTPFADIPQKIAKAASFQWEDPWPNVLAGGAHYGVAVAQHPATGVHRTLLGYPKKIALAEMLAEIVAEGWHPVGLIAWEAARIRCWRPRPKTEMISGVLPHELDLLRTAVHLEKGCYRGQETVAKIVNLGRPPRRLTYLYLEADGDTLPEIGAPIFSGRRKVGVLTSVARDYEDGPVALALLKRAVDVQAVLTIGGVLEEEKVNNEISSNEIFRATQKQIVMQEGKSSVSPTERPGSEFSRRSTFGI